MRQRARVQSLTVWVARTAPLLSITLTCNGFYHGPCRVVEQCLRRARTACSCSRLRPGRRRERPRLAVERAGQHRSRSGPRTRPGLAALHHQQLVAQLARAASASACSARTPGRRPAAGSRRSKKPEVGLQRQVLGLDLPHLLRQPLLRRPLGLQQALGGVGDRLRALALVAQLRHLDAQLRQLVLGVAVEAGDVLAELEGPQASAAEKPNTNANTAQRSGHGRWLRTIMRGALIDRRRRSSFQRIGALERRMRGR